MCSSDLLGSRPDFAQNDGRSRCAAEIDAAIGDWAATRQVAQVLEVLAGAQVPASRIYTARDIAEDPQYRARDMIQRLMTRAGYEVDVPGVVPKLSLTPGAISSAAPDLGADTIAVLERAGVAAERIAELTRTKVI